MFLLPSVALLLLAWPAVSTVRLCLTSMSLPAASSSRPSAAPASTATVSTEDDDDAERAVLWLKLSDGRSVVSLQHRSVLRLRARLATVADRKLPLIVSLQAELSSQQAAIAALRAQLATQQAAFAADEDSAHAVYETALRAIEANSRLALSAAETEVGSLLEAANELASFALVESALQSKCDQLAAKNADNEATHRQRMAAMRRDWEQSRAQLAAAASRARDDSERRYKQQVMAAINISYTRMSDEIATMQHNKQAETRQLRRLDEAIVGCRAAIAEERDRERTEQRQRADSQRALFDVRLELRQARRDITHEQHKRASHCAMEGQRRQREADERRLRRARLECEVREWRAVRGAYERSVRRVRAAVAEVEAARSSNSFQQLVEECIGDVRRGDRPHSPTAPTPTAVVAALSEDERQRALRLLFARIRQAEVEQQERQRRSVEDQQSKAVDGTAVECAGHQRAAWAETAAAVHSEPSFFLTQHQLDEVEEPNHSGGS